jgi:hypothetical protein
MTTHPERPNRTPIIQRSKRRLPEAANEAPTLNDTPAVGQGRNDHHSPKLNRAALAGVLLYLLGWPAVVFLIGFVAGIAKGLSS